MLTRSQTQKHFYKLLNSDLTHHGFIYKEGLNVLKEPFNTKNECGASGLYYCSLDEITQWIDLTNKITLIADVRFLPDSQFVKFDNKSKTDKFILSNIRPLKTFIYNNMDVFNMKDLFQYSCVHGHIDIIILLIEYTYKYYDKDRGLSEACSNGHIKVVKYLISKGADGRHEGFSRACSNGHINIVKLLIENGTNDFLNRGFDNACCSGNINIVKLLIEINNLEAGDLTQGLKNAQTYGSKDIVQLLIEKGAKQTF